MWVQHAWYQRRGRRARRAPKGATRLTPPPPHRGRRRGTEASGEAKKGRAPPVDKCRASCLHRARSVHALEERQQGRPPPPSPSPPQEGGEDGEGTERGNGGGRRGGHKAGGRDGRQAVGAPGSLNPAQKLTNKVPERGRAGGECRGQAGHGRSLGEHKGAREGGNPRVESGGGKGLHSGRGGGGAKGAQRGRWQGTQPQEFGPPPGDRIGPT